MMDVIINFLSGWRELITGLFTEHSFAAALVTLVAIVCFFYLDKENRPRDNYFTAKHLFLVLLGWVIAVPILGWIIIIAGFVITSIGKAFDPILALYALYADQPIVTIVILFMAIVGYFILPYIKRLNAETPLKRGTISIVSFVVLTALIVPIANEFDTNSSAAQQEVSEN